MDFGRMLAAIRRRWWMLAVAVGLGVGIGVLAMRLAAPEYTSTARLFVSTTGGTSSSESYSGEQFSQQRNASYAQIIASEVMAQRVIDELRLPMSAAELSSNITAAIVPRTVLLDVSVRDRSPERAAAIANTLSAQFIAFVGPLETPVGQNEPRSTITVVDRAEVPTAPTSPQLATNLFYGASGGLVLGLLWIAASAVLSRRIESAADLSRLVDAPILGPVEIGKSDVETRLFRNGWTAREAEDFRRMRVLVDAQRPSPRVLLITSSSRDHVATAFAANLAAALCEAAQPTVVIFTSESLGMNVDSPAFDGRETGLAEMLEGRATLDEIIRPTPKPKLSVILPGKSGNLDSLLSSPVMSTVVDSLKEEFDRVVIVARSVNEGSAAAVLSAIADADLLIVDPRSARRRHVQHAISEFSAARAHLLGVVLAKT
ncbi:Wzz/FepE/Etk N-terminal domain-containing protein [Mycobacterium sp. CPCC 205372]|uniref:Wzz/FepE/Etk N-terminal domain-containing protein n=1 Tax=Mycobacterium hippophais TaxID=3016340 RepID=A0ABT4PRS0_9MYCO|nr:Wzz/FepE/Etk N-terminal domain-containing protein [Mycobacterium hippophais]MCZ8379267.1 Wzz/FepE/Etk N-terminal domain-containing protein [Mycobacterium hippophais]